jgi:hypothetical protein
MTTNDKPDPDTEWLDHVRPTGLVVARAILKELGLVPLRQSPLDSTAAQQLIAEDREVPALADPWAFVQQVLQWPLDRIAGAPGGPDLPENLTISVSEHETLLAPDWAVLGSKGSDAAQLLVQLLPHDIDPDRRGALEGWEASAHQRFERLLRETKVFTGVLVSDRELRLVHAPAAETSGWLSFPLHELGSVAGRAMLGGLKLLLDRASLFTNPDNKRLPAVLKESRAAQASVSQELSAQVLGALHELLRGLVAAEPERLRQIAADRSQHVYEGLLTVLMRLVFLLYAEDRGLLPSQTDVTARALYDENYSVRGLFARLSDDAARHPDTMDERRGAWGQLLALFRLLHRGDGSGWIVGRGGKLFDPEVFPFLIGRFNAGETERVISLSDGCLFRVLGGLMTLRGERLSYRTLDVEQIGSVYETVMGFTVERAAGPSIAIKAGKNNHTPVFVDCAALAKVKPGERQKTLKDLTGRSQFSAAVLAALKIADDAKEIAAALGPVIDPRGSPDSAPVSKGTPILQPTEERRRTGSHYTPRDLTDPIVRRALTPVLERLGDAATPAQVLDIKVCDPAMGSGAFLVEACRQLGDRLVKAWASPGPRPAIPADETEELHARRLVAQRCLYGVDKNPMATDLARLSLWLATLAREHEFTFVDHALKSGDSLIGLTRAQIAAAHWDTKPGMLLLRQLLQARVGEALHGRAEIRDAPDDVRREIQEKRYRGIEAGVERVRLIGDAIVSAFFSSEKDKAREIRRAEIESWFAGGGEGVWSKVASAAAELQESSNPVRPFHWEVEFPEVFARDNPGFDAIVGNPPFLRGKSISTEFGDVYSMWLVLNDIQANRSADLVGFFFRRAWSLLRIGGVFGLIATNTIGQGDTRESSLLPIMRAGGCIFAATRRLPWPGEAAVVVSVVHIGKGITAKSARLDGKMVRRISAFLMEGDVDESPKALKANDQKTFQGSVVLGMGFTFDDDGAGDGIGEPTPLSEMKRLVAKDATNKRVILPYLSGEVVNNEPRHRPKRMIIDFGDRSLEAVTKDFSDLLSIVRRKVKPERDNVKRDAYRNRWWQFAEKQPALYAAISKLPRALVISFVSPHMAFAQVPTRYVFAHSLGVMAFEKLAPFAVLQSRIHEYWARFFSSTLEERLRYSPSDCFESFPFPIGFDADKDLEKIGQAYNDHRSTTMIATGLGLTKTYNRFHDSDDKANDILELRRLHDEMDQAVLRAYGWDDLARRAKPEFLTEETEDDPKYEGRLFWSADFRAEVLSRLLALNAERYAAEHGASTDGKKKKSPVARTTDKRQSELL